MGPLVPAARRGAILRKLLAWWNAGHRDLPWRFPQGTGDPYRVWVAEVILQQTRVVTAIPYYRRFLWRFPSLADLATASEEEVLELWSGLGYYARARRLHAAAREALARHGGLPASYGALLALPGFGRYTAGAVASIAFAQRTPCVDGNVVRVLSRLFLVEGRPRAVRERVWTLAGELVPRDLPGDFNQALMELGETVCGKLPRCERCPVTRLCAALRAGRERAIPAAPVPRARPRLEMACAVVARRDSLLLARRPSGGLFGGLWELPSVVVGPEDDARCSLRDSLWQRFAFRVAPREELATVERTLTHRELRLVAYRCQASVATLPQGAPLRMVRRDEMGELALSSAMRALLDELVPWCRARGRLGSRDSLVRSPCRPR